MKNVTMVILIGLLNVIALADGFIIMPPDYTTPLSVKYHKVTCTITDGIAETIIDQEFVNNEDAPVVDGRYIFPVPPGAAISDFSIIIDGEAYSASVMGKEEARQFFRTAVQNSSQASLLEYTDNSAYTLEIGQIAPGEIRRIQISYVEVLPKDNGLSRYLYPLNTEKYSMKLIDTVAITVSISNTTPVTSVYSPSFPVTVSRTDERNVTATYISTKTRPDRDFDLYYKLSEEDISFHMFTYKEEQKDGYFLMLITPQIVPENDEKTLAKDIVFTIDQSGSMAGTKIEQARAALDFCINRLNAEDYFNIVAFQSTVESNADELLAATGENISGVRSFVESIISNGGTNIEAALTTSLSRMGGSERPHYCIFLTDGQPTSGITDIGEISRSVNEANESGTRIFSIGFGFDVNTILIDKLSTDNGGFPLYCSPDQNIEEVVGDLYRKIESPILTSPEYTIDTDGNIYAVTPEKLPDLFSGSEFAIFGRYKSEGTVSVTLRGDKGDVEETLSFETDFPAVNDRYSFLPRLWATQQIGGLMTRIKLQSLTQEDIQPLIDSVEALSLSYGIVTPYTSSLIISGDKSAVTWGLQEASGGGANDASNMMQAMQNNSNAAQTMVIDTNPLPYTVAPQLNQMQNAGEKIFIYNEEGLWKDAAFDSTKESDTITYGSEEYFTLAEDPRLRMLLAVGNQAAFNYGDRNYVIIDDGTSSVRHSAESVRSSSGGRNRFTVGATGNSLTFRRTVAGSNGRVTVYSIDGTVVAAVHFTASQKVVSSFGNHAIASGIYVARYTDGSVVENRRFAVP
jgi:Ca-activated chloride channel homolog